MANLTGFERKVIVGIAEFAVSNNPNVILTTYSLGSCIGVGLYDPLVSVGGLVHIMLPDSTISPEKAATKPGMFVDSGMPAILRAISQMRADRNRLVVSVAGGSQIMDTSGYFNIGRRNCEALANYLRQLGMRVHAEDVGGTVNRTMYLHVASGEIWMKVSGQAQEVKLCRR